MDFIFHNEIKESLEMTAAQANPCQLVTGLEPEDPAKSHLDS